MNLLYKSPVDHRSRVVQLDSANFSIDQLRAYILRKENLPEHVKLCLYCNGKILNDFSEIRTENDLFLQVALPVKGGKGGFGSMLRAIGAQIEKTTNKEACRDLSGRRLRDVNEEKRIKEWIKKQAEKKEEEEKKKKQKLKRLAEMTAPANCQYNDPEFEKARTEIPDIIEESINYGLQQSSSRAAAEASAKRKATCTEDANQSSNDSEEADSGSAKRLKSESKPIKKQALWLGVDIDSDDSSDDDQEEAVLQKDVKSSTN